MHLQCGGRLFLDLLPACGQICAQTAPERIRKNKGQNLSDAEAYSDRLWDVIVIGTGVGGGVAGRRLAEAGLSVLFLEKGTDALRRDQAPFDNTIFDREARRIRGFWPEAARVNIDGVSTDTFLPVGSGVGGSSVFYAAALERPEPHDLDDSKDRPHPTGGWPVSYEAMQPYFEQAEDQFSVHGSPDPLAPDNGALLPELPDQTEGDKALAEQFRAAGLHPYLTHTALRFLPGCKHCFGFKCPRNCKMDGRSAGVEPALESGNAQLLGDCEVTRLVGGPDRLSHVEALVKGAQHTFRARSYVLAGGALGSARLLLASASPDWPEGCANSSGLVGRNLMFHMNEMVAVWPKKGFEGASRTISLRDFYWREGQRFGAFQAMGVDVRYGDLVHYLNTFFDRSFLRRWKILRHLIRIPAAIGARVLGNAKIFVGILEDLPYRENRVTLHDQDPGRFDITYRIPDELSARRKLFRREVRTGLRGIRSRLMGVEPMLNLGHPCGTAVFGTDPAQSVLTSACRAHDVNNLYVVDTSFMPTSMGVNPSLTIAANAMRVADIMAQKLKGQGDE